MKKLKTSLLALMSLCASQSVSAAVIYEAGYTDTLVSSVGTNASNHYGGIASYQGSLFVTGGLSNDVFKMESGSSSSYATMSGYGLGVTTLGDTLYVGTFGNGISEMSATGSPSPVQFAGTAGRSASDMVFASSDYGSLSNQMIVAGGSNNGVYALDVNTGLTTNIVSGTYTSITSVGDQIVASNYSSRQLINIEADGTTNVLLTMSSAIEGVVTDEATGDLFTLNSDGIYRVASDFASFTLFADGFSVDGGWFPGPFAFSDDFTSLYYGTRENSQYVVREISGFDGVAVPTPPTLAVFALGLILLVSRKSRR